MATPNSKSSQTDGRFFWHECEEFCDFEGDVDCQKKFHECTKNPGHSKFIPLSGLKMEHLPLKLQTDKWMDIIKYLCNHTVRVHVPYTSPYRPDINPEMEQPSSSSHCRDTYLVDRCGTGYIRHKKMYKDGACPCMECKKSGEQVTGYMEVQIITSRHVVFDKIEAVKSVFECFYDTPGRKGVKLLYGVETDPSGHDTDKSCDTRWKPNSDNIIIVWCVTHDKDLMDTLNLIKPPDYSYFVNDLSCMNQGFTVSHPHGVHKHISFGHPLYHICPVKPHSLNSKQFEFVKCRLKLSDNNDLTPVSQCQKGRKDNNDNRIIDHASLASTLKMDFDVEYQLPDTRGVFLPYYYTPFGSRIQHGIIANGDPAGWYKFPEGSGYIDSNGKLVYFLKWIEIFGEFDRWNSSTYDIPTCPGSSGALVFIYNIIPGYLGDSFVHCGVDGKLGHKGYVGLFLG